MDFTQLYNSTIKPTVNLDQSNSQVIKETTLTLKEMPFYKEITDIETLFKDCVHHNEKQNFYELYPLGEEIVEELKDSNGEGIGMFEKKKINKFKCPIDSSCDKSVKLRYYYKYGKMFAKCTNKEHQQVLIKQFDVGSKLFINVDGLEIEFDYNEIKYCDYSDDSLSEIAYKLFKDIFIYIKTGEKDNRECPYYYYDSKLAIWTPTTSKQVLSHMKQFLHIPFELYLNKLQIMYNLNKDDDKLKKEIKEVRKQLSSKIKKISTYKTLIESLQTSYKGFLKNDFLDLIDNQTHLLPVRNGNINLKTGKVDVRKKEDYITRFVDKVYFDKEKQILFNTVMQDEDKENRREKGIKTVNKFFENIFNVGDNDYKSEIEYFQALMGYCITGETDCKAFTIFHGDSGDNGKSTICTYIDRALSKDFSAPIDKTVVVKSKNKNEFKTFLINRAKNRLCYIDEFNDDDVIDMGEVKKMVSPEAVLQMRDMNGKPKDYEWKSKFILISNDVPKFSSTGQATEARLILVPFDISFRSKGSKGYVEGGINQKEPDQELMEELDNNPDYFLYWLVEGAMNYYQKGRRKFISGKIPPRFDAMKTEQMKEADPFLNWLSCNCEINGAFETECQELFDDYFDFCSENDLNQLKKQQFSTKLTKHNIKKCGAQYKKRKGIKIKSKPELKPKLEIESDSESEYESEMEVVDIEIKSKNYNVSFD